MLPEFSNCLTGVELRQTFSKDFTPPRDARTFQLAFHEGVPVRYELLKPAVISKVIQEIDAELATSSARQFAEDLVEQWSGIPGSGVGIAREAADFMVSVTSEPKKPRLYCLGVASESVAIASMRQGRTPILVSPRPPSVAAIYALLTGSQAKFERRDPVEPPAGELFPAKLEATFAAPPLARELDSGGRIWSQGDFGIQSAEGRYVQFLAQDVADSAVILVSNRFLFARGSEESLRRFLIDTGRIRAVISFPSGLLSTTYVPFTLLILGKENSQSQTLFCRVDETSHMSSAAGKLRTHDRRFTGHDEVLLALMSPIAPWSRAVSREEIQQRDYVLSVDRYLSTDAQAAVERAAGNRKTGRLGDLVTVVKPQALRSIDGHKAVPVFEVGPGELPEFHFLATASRQRNVDPHDLQRYAQQIIQPEDVILSVKGTIGRSAVAMPASREVAIVPSQASERSHVLHCATCLPARVP